MQEPSMYAYLINSAAMLLIVLMFFGLTHKISTVLLAVFAYPVYLAMYAFELPIKNSDLLKRRFFSLNIPTTYKMKYLMNLCAFFVVLFILPNLLVLYTSIELAPQYQAKVIMKLFFSSNNFQIWSNSLAIIFIFIIYIISYKSELDTRDPYEKIESLTVPSLWKTLIKN